jgi:hypothetical protein
MGRQAPAKYGEVKPQPADRSTPRGPQSGADSEGVGQAAAPTTSSRRQVPGACASPSRTPRCERGLRFAVARAARTVQRSIDRCARLAASHVTLHRRGVITHGVVACQNVGRSRWRNTRRSRSATSSLRTGLRPTWCAGRTPEMTKMQEVPGFVAADVVSIGNQGPRPRRPAAGALSSAAGFIDGCGCSARAGRRSRPITERHPDGVDEVNSDYSINGACQSQPRTPRKPTPSPLKGRSTSTG